MRADSKSHAFRWQGWVRVFLAEEEILGATFVGERVLGSFQWKRNRRSLDGVHKESEAG